MKAFIDECLYHRMSPFTIVAEAKCRVLHKLQHDNQMPTLDSVKEGMEKGSIPIPRDFLVSCKDVSNRRAGMEKMLWKFGKNDAENVRILQMNNSASFLLYQEQSEREAFIAVLQTEWQRKKLLELGHNNAILMDATYNTNNLKVPFYLPIFYAYFFLPCHGSGKSFMVPSFAILTHVFMRVRSSTAWSWE